MERRCASSSSSGSSSGSSCAHTFIIIVQYPTQYQMRYIASNLGIDGFLPAIYTKKRMLPTLPYLDLGICI